MTHTHTPISHKCMHLCFYSRCLQPTIGCFIKSVCVKDATFTNNTVVKLSVFVVYFKINYKMIPKHTGNFNDAFHAMFSINGRYVVTSECQLNIMEFFRSHAYITLCLTGVRVTGRKDHRGKESHFIICEQFRVEAWLRKEHSMWTLQCSHRMSQVPHARPDMWTGDRLVKFHIFEH